MIDIQQNADGDYELKMPSGRVAVSGDRASLEALHANVEAAAAAKIAFLETWKAGIKIGGVRFFDVTSETIDAATDKEQLRPAWHYIEENAGVLSHGERIFLYAMCGFFNDEWATQLFTQYNESGHPAELAAILDPERRQIIADLMINYGGW